MKRFAVISLAFAITTLGPFCSVSTRAEVATARTAIAQISSVKANPADASAYEHASVTLSASQLNALRIGSCGDKPDFINSKACLASPQ